MTAGPEASLDSKPTDLETELAEIAKEAHELPKELGVLLIFAGVAGLILPGPMGIPALMAGGFVLWPGASSRAARWLKRKHPVVYTQSVGQIHRFLDDMERRYPSPKRD